MRIADIRRLGEVHDHLTATELKLPLYVAEFQFRYNNRHNPEIFEAAIAGC